MKGRSLYKYYRLFFLMRLITFSGYAQTVTSASGLVQDSVTGEDLPFVTVMFENSTIGTATNDNGEFELRNTQGYHTLQVSFVGYETKKVPLKAGAHNAGLEILLTPSTMELDEVVIRPKRERYHRRNNPAVDLIRNVIEHKDQNRITSLDEYQVETYEKISLALDQFNPDAGQNAFLRRFPFLVNYVDSSAIDGNPILTLSIREKLADQYYRKDPRSEKIIYKALRQEGIDRELDNYGAFSANLDEIFHEVNIFDNDIKFLLNRFVSPLSSTLATAYYQYFIMDTVAVNGDQCIDLAFVPANSQSYGFTGRLYILTDGTYAVKKATLNVPKQINLNFVNHIQIEQEFKQTPEGVWAPDRVDTYVQGRFIKGTQPLYVHQLRSYDHYRYEVANRDSVFALQGDVYTAPNAVLSDLLWAEQRQVPLSDSENAMGEIMDQFYDRNSFKVFMKVLGVVVSGFIETSREHDTNKLDIGPMNSSISFNEVEGLRLRAGAMTTANLHPHLFFGGYAAYGFKDHKWKYSAKATYSFNDKEYHEKETPLNNLSLSHEFDIFTPGHTFFNTGQDNMLLSFRTGKVMDKMNYLRTTRLQYEKEWLNGLTVSTWLQHQNNEAAGALQYIRHDGNDLFTQLTDFTTAEWGASLRFAPGERPFNTRVGKESVGNLSNDAPIFFLSHQIGTDGVAGGDYSYQHTELSMEKRIWLSSFGHIDTKIKAGKVWDKVPFPLLIMPNANQSWTIQKDAFHLMNAMEFVADQYVSITANYHLKGFILNRIPLVNRLKMREVVSFSGVYGDLSDKNSPYLTDGLFMFPEGTFMFGNKPYMEYSVGVENILKVLQISYYRRLSYLDHPEISKGGIRVNMRFTF